MDSGDSAKSMTIDPNWGQKQPDHDSGLGDDSQSTNSLHEEILRYRKLHGRTYQNFSDDSLYWGPNDDRQNQGLDLSHHMIYLALDQKLFMSPIGDNPERVIDIGTGTGIWAIDFADQYPNAEVTGTDLSPIQPAWVPPNCRFELDDAQLPWTYPDNYFDFIHIRCLLGSVRDWPALYSEVYRCLKPGGWFEHFDYHINITSDDDSIPHESPLYKWGETFIGSGDRMGQTFQIIDGGRNVAWFQDTGFQNIRNQRFKMPIGGWPADPKWKEIGLLNQQITVDNLEGYIMYMAINVLGWEYAELQEYLARTRKTLWDRSVHSYFTAGVTWAQKL